jgi:hypothetical protein
MAQITQSKAKSLEEAGSFKTLADRLNTLVQHIILINDYAPMMKFNTRWYRVFEVMYLASEQDIWFLCLPVESPDDDYVRHPANLQKISVSTRNSSLTVLVTQIIMTER